MSLKVKTNLSHKLKIQTFSVIIDYNLSCRKYISYICRKVAKGVGILAKARKYLNKAILMNLYHTFGFSYIYVGLKSHVLV